jgi:hypothetical protein
MKKWEGCRNFIVGGRERETSLLLPWSMALTQMIRTAHKKEQK